MDGTSEQVEQISSSAAPKESWLSRAGAGLKQASDRKGEGIGVFQSSSSLHLARVSAQSGKLPQVTATRTIPLRAASMSATEHAEQLRQALHEFGGGSKSALWCCLESPNTVMQTIRVPRVRSSQLANVAFWTLKKERNLSPDDTVFDFEELRAVEEDGNRQTELLAVAVPKPELESVTSLFGSAGMSLEGVTPSVFAFRNLLRFAWPDQFQRQCIVICINEDSTDVLIFSGGKPHSTRTVRTGVDSLRDAFCQTLDIDESDARLQACMGVLRGDPPTADVFEDGESGSSEDVFGWVRPAARRLVRNVQRTLHAFETELGAGSAATFLVAGAGAAYPLITQFLGEQLGIRIHTISPSESQFLHLDLAPEEAKNPESQSGLAVAIGLALASVYSTANLLFTYRDRRRAQQRLGMLRAVRIIAFTVLASLICAFAIVRLMVVVRERQHNQESLDLSSSESVLDADTINVLMSEAAERQATVRKLAAAYYVPAVVAEISAITPSHIKLLSVTAVFPRPEQKLAAEANAGEEAETPAVGKTSAARKLRRMTLQAAGGGGPISSDEKAGVTVSGVIAGRRDQLDPELAEYILRVAKSPFFRDPVVASRRLEAVNAAFLKFGRDGSDHLLHFEIKALLIGE